MNSLQLQLWAEKKNTHYVPLIFVGDFVIVADVRLTLKQTSVVLLGNIETRDPRDTTFTFETVTCSTQGWATYNFASTLEK